MLTWTEHSEGWRSDGYLIQLAGPFRWIVLDAARAEAAVTAHPEPMATARTLTAAKREAEIVERGRRRAELRRRHLGLLAIAVAAGFLLAGGSALYDLVVIATVFLVAVRSVGVIVGTYVGSHWRGNQIFYQ